MGEISRVVVKVGSTTLAGAGGAPDEAILRTLAEQVAALREMGIATVVVTSGAIAAGVRALGLPDRPKQMPSLQAVASVGQVRVIGEYARVFAEAGLAVGQVLVTRHDTAHRQQYLHARDTLERLLEMGVIPVVNENDTTAVDEIRFGDNDTLAALVGVMIRADLVILLTDIAGLFTADPRADEEASLLEEIDEVTAEVVSAAGGPGSSSGSGGMATKIEAAKVLRRAGIAMVVCDGRKPRVIVDAAEGKPVGTRFAAGEGSVSGRKLWIAVGRRPAGSVTIDDGAKEALCSRGKSLLPAGVVSVSGAFDAGDVVVVKDRQGGILARGLTSMSAHEVQQAKGLKTGEVSAVLPDYRGQEVIHRDRLVIL